LSAPPTARSAVARLAQLSGAVKVSLTYRLRDSTQNKAVAPVKQH